MSVHFDPWRQIYDLYSFDAPYDLEPTAFPKSLRNYEETIDSHKNSTSADIEDEEDEFGGLDLTFEEAEPDRHFPASGFRLFPERDTARKKILKE